MNTINSMENKAKLWNECISRNYFKNIPENLQSNIQKKFEESVTMFSTQNSSNNSIEYINEQILKHFHDELVSFTSYDKKSIIDDRKNDFEKRLQEKQAEFDMMMSSNKPNDIDFTQQADEPLKENIDDLIAKQTADREQQLKIAFSEQSVNDNLVKNEVIAPSYVSQSQEMTQTVIPQIPQINNTDVLMNEIASLRQIVESQSNLLNQLTKTQIQILSLLRTNY